jgi:hypothetical protein
MSGLLSHFLAGGIGARLAYLDPGSGSYLIQILIAAALGGAFAIRAFWKQIAGFFAKLFGVKKDDNQDGQPK